MERPRALIPFILALALFAPADGRAEWRLPPERSGDVVRLVTGGALPLQLDGGLVIRDIAIGPDGVVATVEGPGGGALTLRPWCGPTAPEAAVDALGGEAGGASFRRTGTFALRWTGAGPPPDAVRRLADGIAARDDGTLRGVGDPCAPDDPLADEPPASAAPGVAAPEPAGGEGGEPVASANAAAAAALAAFLAVGLSGFLLARRRRGRVWAATRGAVPFVAAASAWGVLGLFRLAPPAEGVLHAYALGTAVVLGPFLAGLAIGAAARLAGRVRLALVAVAALAAVVAAWLVVPGVPQVGALDVFVVGALVALGVCLAGVPRDARGARRAVAAAAVSAVAIALLFELAARLFLPPPPALPRPDRARLAFRTIPDERVCAGLHPDWPAPPPSASFVERTRLVAERPFRVLWVGDSVTEGEAMPPGETFVDLLSARQPRVAHVNAGYGGTGTDFHLLLLRRWLDRLALDGIGVDLVVLVDSGNDAFDLGNRYLCCAGGPLLTFPPEGPPRARCPEPVRSFGVAALLAHSPAPYPLRVFSGWSRAAAYACALLAGREGPPGGAAVQDWERALAAFFDEATARGIPVLYVQHADYWQVEAAKRGEGAPPRPPRPVSERGVPVVPLQPVYVTALEAGAGLLFGDTIHLSRAGHRVVAEHLAPIVAQHLPPGAAGEL